MMRILALMVLGFVLIPGVKAAETHTVSFCQALIEHKPAPGVAYQAGVDVKGRPVEPADLPGPDYNIFDPVIIPVQMDLLENLGLATSVDGLKLEPYVSEIKIYKDGRIEYNGQDIAGPAHDLCASAPSPAPKPAAPASPATSGQPKPNVLESPKIKGRLIEGQYPEE